MSKPLSLEFNPKAEGHPNAMHYIFVSSHYDVPGIVMIHYSIDSLILLIATISLEMKSYGQKLYVNAMSSL